MNVSRTESRARTTLTRAVALALGAFCTPAFTSAALAAEPAAAPEDAVLEEVTVTAQRRAERLQDTPISISAFTAAAIDRLGVTNVGELAQFAPNVRFDFTAPISGASNAAGVFIRGIGQSDFALTTEAGVGTYVDGVYMSRSLGGVLDVLDVERMEVLRGPQGTLFGRNTIGGAINIVSARPEAEFGGSVEAAIGSFNRRHLRASVNLPVSDALRLRLTASSKERDGYVNALLAASAFGSPAVPRGATLPGSGSAVDFGNENRQAMRLLGRWDAGGALTADFSVDLARVRENNAPSVLRGVTDTLANGPVAFVYNTFEAPATTLPGFANALYSSANFLRGDLDGTYATGPNGTRIDSKGAALTLTWRVAEDLELKSISALRRTTGYFSRDADGSPIAITHTANYDYEHEQLSQELQFNGATLGGRLKFALGAYWFQEDGSDPLVVTFPASFGTLSQDVADIDNDSIAAYAQGTYAVTERLSVTAGLRYTRDEKAFVSDQYLVTGSASPLVFGAPAGTLVPLVPRNSQVDAKFKNTAPRVSIDFKAAEDLLLYASYSEGFKSGGFNLRYVQPRPAVLPFDPEFVTTVEIGAKAELLDRRLRVNVAAFDTDYDDVQLTVFENLGAPVTLNAGDARIRGAELEIAAKPASGLDLAYSLGYLDAEYRQIRQSAAIIVTPEQRITTDTRLPKTPKIQHVVAADWRLPLASGAAVRFHADWRYTDDVYNDAQNSVFLFQEAYDVANVSVEYVPSSTRWSLRLFVDNVGDERYVVSGDSNYGIGFHEAAFNRPREWGIAGRVNF